MKYNEFLATEIKTSKTTWDWFPCIVNCIPMYSNGEVAMTKRPVSEKIWKKYSGVMGTARSIGYAKNPPKIRPSISNYAPLLHVKSLTQREHIAGRNGSKPGLVRMASSDGDATVTLARHLYSLVIRRYGRDVLYPYYNGETGPVYFTLGRDGSIVALIAPLKA